MLCEEPMKTFPLGEGKWHTSLGTSSWCKGRQVSKLPGGETLPRRKRPGKVTRSHTSRIQPGFVWAALASFVHFWAISLHWGFPPEVYFTLKKENHDLEVIKAVKHLN